MAEAEISGPLPNVFIIGAAKCGTSSLHNYLDQHPEIAMTRVKEPGVFSEPRYLPRFSGYAELFERRAARMGESSTSYTRWPVEGDAAARIHAAVPDAKLIYLVRDPVERMISDYVHHYAGGHEHRSISEAFEDYESLDNYYACTSRYATQIERYLDHFDPGSLLIMDQAELRADREAALARVFMFLGVDPEFTSAHFQTEWLTRADYLDRGGLWQRLRGSAAGRAFRRLPPGRRLPIARLARRALSSTMPRPVLEPDRHAELAAFLAPEVERLGELRGHGPTRLPGLPPGSG